LRRIHPAEIEAAQEAYANYGFRSARPCAEIVRAMLEAAQRVRYNYVKPGYHGQWEDEVPTMVKLHKEGQSLVQIAAAVRARPGQPKLYTALLRYILRRAGCNPVTARPKLARSVRDSKLWDRRKQGVTYRQLGGEFGISAARARQIIVRMRRERNIHGLRG